MTLWAGFATAQPAALIHAHSHNDYLHKRPLMDALENGFCSVEADIYLVNGQLLVAHDLNKTTSDRTLQSLYLDPLRERAKQNVGKIFPDATEFFLLIDIKSDADKTYRALREVLKKYSDILTSFENGKRETRAVTVVLTGNRPKELLAKESIRYAGMDGRIEDLNRQRDQSMLWISDNWTKHFEWRGEGSIDRLERVKLKQIIAKAHKRNLKVRFWEAPDQPNAWKEFRADGLDFINTDDLAGLRAFLESPGRR